MSAADLFAYDRAFGTRYVIGCDEVGRGCLAGPVVAAAVRFDYEQLTDEQIAELDQLGDSKKLTPRRRERLMPLIKQHASAWTVVSRSASFIDQHGIQEANLGALGRAAQRVWLPDAAVTVLSDGYSYRHRGPAHERVIKGDGTSAAIAAASVIAKVTRDRMMSAAAVRWPGYGFERNAGYGAPIHLQALGELGPTPIHRFSFAPLRPKS